MVLPTYINANNTKIRIRVMDQIFLNLLKAFMVSSSLYSITIFQYFMILFVYKMNLSNRCTVSDLSLSNFLSFFLFWLTIAKEFHFILLHSLQRLIQNLIFLPQWLHIPLVNMTPIVIIIKNDVVPMFYIFSTKCQYNILFYTLFEKCL